MKTGLRMLSSSPVPWAVQWWGVLSASHSLLAKSQKTYTLLLKCCDEWFPGLLIQATSVFICTRSEAERLTLNPQEFSLSSAPDSACDLLKSLWASFLKVWRCQQVLLVPVMHLAEDCYTYSLSKSRLTCKILMYLCSCISANAFLDLGIWVWNEGQAKRKAQHLTFYTARIWNVEPTAGCRYSNLIAKNLEASKSM